MDKKSVEITKSVLGEDIFEVLEKYEIYKPNTKSVVDPEEIKVALQIVPRSILSYLFANLKYLSVGEIADLELPFAPNAKLHVEKLTNDNYQGEIVQNGKRISEFKFRSLPSIGLILLSTFELYDLSMLDEIKNNKPTSSDEAKIDKLQSIIDERLALNRLVQDVVDKKLSERDAIDKLINEKLHGYVTNLNDEPKEGYMEQELDKKSKLKLFLENKDKKRQELVELDKSEIKCLDCDTVIYKTENENKIKLCICYGEYHNKEIRFKKIEKNHKVKFNFPQKFSTENVEMLLDTIKNNGGQ